jgi:MtrB/PioB family decaheme-associated outer membrane protein
MAAQAQTDSVSTTIDVGLGLVSGDSTERALFGQYNGLRNRSTAVTLGLDYSLRKESTSTWVDLQGSNLLGDTRELRLVWKNPGDWKLSASYGELVRNEPNAVNSGVMGIGSTQPQVVNLGGGAGSGTDYDFRTKRTGLGLGLAKWITPALQFELDLKNEKKEGARLSGIGLNCPSVIAPTCGANTGWAVLMLPEPVHANHSQVEARLNYALDKLRVSLGYYGSFYRNDNSTFNPSMPGALNTTSNAALLGLLGQPLALSPDNQAHQFDLSGSFDFSKTTRGTFKLGRTVATQTSDFLAAGLVGAPTGVTNLGGQVNTTTGKLGLSSRPLPQLSLLADLRYENRDDQTPIALYNTEGIATYTNRNLPYRKTNGKVQASWNFNSDYRGTIGADRESIDHGTFTATSAVSGISALRQKTDETTVRADLRRKMAENVSGSIGVSSSKRSGSNWLKDNNGLGLTEVTNPSDPVAGLASTAIYMPSLADRKRDKIRLFSDWQASESLTLQLSAETGKDRFDTPSVYGLRDTRMNQLSVDWGYTLSDNWALNGYLAQSVQNLNQARPAAYVMAFDNKNLDVNFGVTGKLSSTFNVGGGLSFMNDRSVYAQTLDASATADSIALLAASGGLPDVVYRQTALKLFGKYTLDKASSVRVDLVHQRASMSDWAWAYEGIPFTFSDGSTVLQKPTQSINFIGVSYSYQLP